MTPRSPISTLFPYTTLFRSQGHGRHVVALAGAVTGVHQDRQVRQLFDGRDHRQIQRVRSEEHTSELQSQSNLVCRLLLEKKNMAYFIRPDSVDARRRGGSPT